MKTNLLSVSFLLILLTSSSASLQSIQVNKLKLNDKGNLSADTTKTKLTEKSPVLAGTLSFIVPGLALGQFYNEQHGKFITHAAISTVCITTFLISMQYVEIKLDPGGGEYEESRKSKTAGAFAFFSAVVFIGNYIISVADAVVSVQNINKQYRMQKNRSALEEKLKLGLTFDKNNQLKLKTIINL